MAKLNFTLLDGAMGTELRRRGAELGRFPEAVNLTRPELVQSVHRDYAAAGSEIVYAFSFGANARKARGASVEETVAAALRNARQAVPKEVAVALDVGPLGGLLEPYGDLEEDEARALYAQVFRAGAGADLIALETFFDAREAALALKTAKAVSDTPVFVTLTFQAGGRTLTGNTVADMAAALCGADALGFNCSLGPDELLPLVRTLRAVTALPLIAKPNAGMPDAKTGAYAMDPARFTDRLRPILELGVAYAGGCCGTEPGHIAGLAGLRA